MIDDEERARFEAAKQASTAQLLFKAARLVDALALKRLSAATGADIRPAHTKLFPHIDLDGTRPTVLAERLGVSKQAVGPLVDELETMGVIERVPDPADKRAKLVRFARVDGELGLFVGLRALGVLEQELRASVGAERWEGLRAGLVALLETLEEH